MLSGFLYNNANMKEVKKRDVTRSIGGLVVGWYEEEGIDIKAPSVFDSDGVERIDWAKCFYPVLDFILRNYLGESTKPCQTGTQKNPFPSFTRSPDAQRFISWDISFTCKLVVEQMKPFSVRKSVRYKDSFWNNHKPVDNLVTACSCSLLCKQ